MNSILAVNKPRVPITICEKERGFAQISKIYIPDLLIPVCSKEDGLYMEVQSSPFPRSKWCVNRYTGDRIADTGRKGDETPVCPGTW